MGTPDILGTYGTFSYYTDNPPDNADSFSGGNSYTVWVEGNEVRAELVGPANIFLNEKRPPDSTAPFTVYIDPERNAAKIEIGDEEVLLNVGDWSRWVEVKFHMAPTVDTWGIVRFYLKEVRPDFKLYVTPININPLKPAMPISTPDDYAVKIAENVGMYYTQGMPQDTKALQYGVLSDGEYAQQINLILEERKKIFDYEFGRWNEGLLFFYFCTLDLNQHTWWRAWDKESPMWTNELDVEYGDFIEKLYIEFDGVLGKVLDKLGPEDTLIVMSDHGFAPYRRQFHLNTWLLDNGYIKLEDSASQATVEYLEGVDWTSTRAYSLGINALYINLVGREANGIVTPEEAEGLVKEISRKLEEVVDPQNGKHPIRKAYISKEEFTGSYMNIAPDIIVGFDRGYRASDDSALGSFPFEHFADNKDTWSGDHCIDPYVVPGILFCNKKINSDLPRLYDLTINILKEYGIEAPADMIGTAVW